MGHDRQVGDEHVEAVHPPVVGRGECLVVGRRDTGQQQQKVGGDPLVWASWRWAHQQLPVDQLVTTAVLGKLGEIVLGQRAVRGQGGECHVLRISTGQ